MGNAVSFSGVGFIICGVATNLAIQGTPDSWKPGMLTGAVALYFLGGLCLAVAGWQNRGRLLGSLPRLSIAWPGQGSEPAPSSPAASGVIPPTDTGPNQSISWAIDHVVRVLGLTPETEIKAWHDVRQLARLGTITLWGRPHDSRYKPREAIPAEHWRDYHIDVMAAKFANDIDESKSEPDNDQLHIRGERYRGLMVNDHQILLQWPEGPKTPERSVSLDASRRLLIAEARLFVATAMKADNSEKGFRKALESSEVFMRLHPHLSERFLKAVRPSDRVSILRGGSQSTMPDLAIFFLKEIDRLELEWGLR